ncbi:hypothetical protein CHS0354_040108, partial [Potamilus streckersoni]
MNQNPTNIDDIRKAANLAEKPINNIDNDNSPTISALLEELKQIKDEFQAVSSALNIENNSFSQSFVHGTKQPFRSHRLNSHNHNMSYQPAQSFFSSVYNYRCHYTPRLSHDAYYHSQPHRHSQTLCLGCGGLCTSRRVCRAR